jgi:hypothetical protein
MNDDLISVGTPMPRAAKAEWIEKRLVRITWKNGKTSVVDLAPTLLSRRVYIPLREDDALFAQLRVDEYGAGIEWPCGLDFSALWLSKLPSVEFDNASSLSR